MKKSLLAIAVAAALPTVATAQVTIGGTIHAGIQDNGQPGQKATGISLGGGANAINITASEEIAKGLTGGARFQLRFNAVTGDVNSASGRGDSATALFHDASVFLSGAFGTVRLGKIFEDSNCSFDPWGCATTGGSSIALGPGGTAGSLVAANTMNNSVYYVSPNFAGLTASFHTTVGGTKNATAPAAGSLSGTGGGGFRDSERQVINLNYASGPIIAQALFVRGGNAAGNGGGISDLKIKQQALGLSYDFKVARVMINRIDDEDATGKKTREANVIGAVVPIAGNIQLLGAYIDDGARPAASDRGWSLGANYLMSKRTTLGLDFFDREVANGSTGWTLRARHTF